MGQGGEERGHQARLIGRKIRIGRCDSIADALRQEVLAAIKILKRKTRMLRAWRASQERIVEKQTQL
jgi:hypothetical protein